MPDGRKRKKRPKVQKYLWTLCNTDNCDRYCESLILNMVILLHFSGKCKNYLSGFIGANILR